MLKNAKSRIAKDLSKMLIKNVCNIYRKEVSEAKNKRLKKILRSDTVSTALDA